MFIDHIQIFSDASMLSIIPRLIVIDSSGWKYWVITNIFANASTSISVNLVVNLRHYYGFIKDSSK